MPEPIGPSITPRHIGGTTYDWRLDRLTVPELRKLLLDLETEHNPKRWEYEIAFPVDFASAQGDIDRLMRGRSETQQRDLLNQAVSKRLTDFKSLSPTSTYMGRTPSITDIFQSVLDTPKYDAWLSDYNQYNRAVELGEQAVRSTMQRFPEAATPPDMGFGGDTMPTGGPVVPVPTFAGPKPQPKFPSANASPEDIEKAFNDAFAYQQQMADTGQYGLREIRSYMDPIWDHLGKLRDSALVKQMTPYQKGQLDLSQEDLAFRRAKHEASLGESQAARGQQAAQFAERQALERQQERNRLMQALEAITQQQAQLMTQAAQYAVPEGMTQVPGTDIPVVSTPVTFPQGAPNIERALAMMGG